jgi:hypothetical protein
MLTLPAMEPLVKKAVEAEITPGEREKGSAREGLVLEIGGGHNPYPQSDVIVDKFLENKERGGDLKVDRPVVIADFQQLPFKDGSFAYAICSHVIEHVEDVPSAVAELTRVAKAGYLETPSALTEIIEPHRDYHRWYVIRQGRKLLFHPKRNAKPPLQSVLNRLIFGNFAFKLFYLSNPDLIATRLWWKGKIDYEVFGEDAPLDFDRLYPDVKQSPLRLITGLAKHYLAKLRRKAQAKARGSRPAIDLSSLLCCPVCKSSFRYEGEKMICEKCHGYYRKQGGLYHLLREDITPL